LGCALWANNGHSPQHPHADLPGNGIGVVEFSLERNVGEEVGVLVDLSAHAGVQLESCAADVGAEWDQAVG
jgi:hypothetical protein